MRVKSKGILTGLMMSILIGLFTVLLLIMPNAVTTASAATNTSAVLTTNGRFENLVGTPLNAYNPLDFIKVTIEPSSASGTGTIQNNETLNWTYMTAKAEIIDTKRFKDSFYVELIKDDVQVLKNTLSGKGNQTLFSTSLTDGNYVIKYNLNISLPNSVTYSSFYYVFYFTNDVTAPKGSLTANGSTLTSGSYTNKSITYSASDSNFKYIYYKKPGASTFSTTTNDSYFVDATPANSGWWEFYSTDSLGNASEKVKAYLDCKAPTMTLANGMRFGTTVGNAITVTATDEATTAKLYVKFESEEWFTTGSSYTIPDTERNGRYYFYAEDANGNRTDTSWIILSTEEPSGSLVKSDSDNSVYFVWNNEYWSATLDGSPYVEGRIISAEGTHRIVLSNNAYKTKDYNFTITHFYKMVSQTPATCTTNGIKKYECSQCGATFEETQYASGHHYNVISTPSTCTDREVIVYACNDCGARYEAEGDYPTGHNYVSTITKEPTCTTEGERHLVCENCGDEYSATIAANGHNYEISDTTTKNGVTTRTYTCTECGHSYKQELGDQYEEVANYVEYLFQQYEPYMWWVLLAAAGVWSIVIGVMIAIAQKNEDKEKAKKMLINYVIGLVVIAVIVVAAPFLIRGIAALVT